MAQARTILNNVCVKCDAVHAQMVKVGCLPFCNQCYDDEFVKTGLAVEDEDRVWPEVDPKSETYLKYLKRYMEIQ